MPAGKDERVSVKKTYKLFIGGKFPRTESGRYFEVRSSRGELVSNVSRASRKDLRNAVEAARAACGGWGGRTAFNRGQILYRMAEMLEGRRAQFAAELRAVGATPKSAEKEVTTAIDRLIYYAGWADKYQQIFSSVNPVSSPHFNFSVLEPMGVVVVLAPALPAFLPSVSLLAPVIAGGNAVIVVTEGQASCPLLSLAEVVQVSDVPGGVVNFLAGERVELAPVAAAHMDVNAVVDGYLAPDDRRELELAAAENFKRMPRRGCENWFAESAAGPEWIADCQEVKTTWHPVESAVGSSSGY